MLRAEEVLVADEDFIIEEDDFGKSYSEDSKCQCSGSFLCYVAASYTYRN